MVAHFVSPYGRNEMCNKKVKYLAAAGKKDIVPDLVRNFSQFLL
jgi:hypothetical protein